PLNNPFMVQIFHLRSPLVLPPKGSLSARYENWLRFGQLCIVIDLKTVMPRDVVL
ncbi:hypothetical protein D046_5964B, partial [Vibrio parahaemolyticus V-223/04]